jgi:multidrug efflux pump subunit AcrB
MLSHFFIERPIFASVLSIVITLAGAVAVFNLPLAQYPPITPPSIWVQANYPGANAQVVADSVAAPIEQMVNGVEDMLYMVSQSNNDGSYQLTVTFKPGVNLNFAQVLVQNRINLALPLLPDVIKATGVTTRKRNPDILQVIALYSPNDRYDQLYLSNFATIRVADELKRLRGVGDVIIFGQQDYSMRVWLDPEKLASLNMTAVDVVNAIREQNRQVAGGHIGQEPIPLGKSHEIPITLLGRLSEPEQYEAIVLRTDWQGRKVLLKDVGRAELGAKNMDSTSKLNGKPNGSIAVWALPDANSIEVADRVIAKMDELKKYFPEDIDYAVSLDMTPFIKESIKEVVRTLIEAIVLVAAVVLLFLQNWRSALIPLVAVPVAVVGTFAVMAIIGFSLNNLTLFGLVLAIGIVVDDAIVVVEAIEHHIEQGLSPRRAAHKAMEEVSAPVIAVGLVLCAVFVPCAFISGITGQFFRQFALTIAASTVISAFNSLTLSPALAAILLQPKGAKKDIISRILDFFLGWFFRLFNWTFRRSSRGYTGLVGASLAGHAPLSVLALAVGGGAYGWLLPSIHRRVWDWLQDNGITLPYFLLDWASSIPEDVQQFLFDPLWVPCEVRMIVGGLAGLLLGTLLLLGLRCVAACVAAIVRPSGHWKAAQCLLGPRRVASSYVPRLALSGVAVVLLGYGAMVANTLYGYEHLPAGYIPNQDQGRFYIAVQLPDAASLERTQQAMDKIQWLVQQQPGIQHVTEIAGQSFTLNANGSYFGNFFVSFKDFETRAELARQTWLKLTDKELASLRSDDGVPTADLSKLHSLTFREFQEEELREELDKERLAAYVTILLQNQPLSAVACSSYIWTVPNAVEHEKFADLMVERAQRVHLDMSATAIVGRVQALLDKEVPEATASLFTPPPVSGLGSASGFKFIVEDRGNLGIVELEKQVQRLIDKSRQTDANGKPKYKVERLYSIFRANVPQLFMDIERDKCEAMGINPMDVFLTLQIYLGSLYVNEFNKFSRTWQVNVQASGEYRTNVDKIRLIQVRNNNGEMVPLGSVVSVRETGGPINIGRYNLYPAAAILGSTKPGVSSGEGIKEMERLFDEVRIPGMAYEWTEINYMQIDADKNIWNNLIFPLAVLFVFLVLAAQYESWSLPLAVILVVPMCILGSLTGVAIAGDDINIFTQIGFVVLVGLASKNAILIVEFAKHKHEEGGLSRYDATLAACRLRLRPIIMTSFAFILGVVPLLISHGAGSEMRQKLGVAVFSGMLGVTLFGIFLTPVFFYAIAGFAETPLFAAARVRFVGRMLVYLANIVTLFVPWLLMWTVGRIRRGRAVPLPKKQFVIVENRATVNGNGAVDIAPGLPGVRHTPAKPEVQHTPGKPGVK